MSGGSIVSAQAGKVSDTRVLSVELDVRGKNHQGVGEGAEERPVGEKFRQNYRRCGKPEGGNQDRTRRRKRRGR